MFGLSRDRSFGRSHRNQGMERFSKGSGRGRQDMQSIERGPERGEQDMKGIERRPERGYQDVENFGKGSGRGHGHHHRHEYRNGPGFEKGWQNEKSEDRPGRNRALTGRGGRGRGERGQSGCGFGYRYMTEFCYMNMKTGNLSSERSARSVSNIISADETECPLCENHCPSSEPGCRKGERYFKAIQA